MTLSLLATGRVPISKGKKGYLLRNSQVSLESFKLDLKKEEDKNRITRHKPICGTPLFEGQCARNILQFALSVDVGNGNV